jgi:uncharacterized protein with PQ loop repeat
VTGRAARRGLVMASGLLQALTILYGAAGVVTIVSYAPQIYAVWRSETGAADVSLAMWCLWSIAATIAVLYAQFVARDKGYFLMSLGNAAGCFLVTGLVVFRRSQTTGCTSEAWTDRR